MAAPLPRAVGRADPRGGHPAASSATGSPSGIRRLNELGFDVDEVDLIDEPGGGSRLRVRTRVAEPGHHRRRLFALTGLDVWENQARRLLNDIASYRGWMEQVEGSGGCPRRWPPTAGWPRSTTRWSPPIPRHLRDRLDEAEIFHEILEHRWFLSEAAGRDVGTSAGGGGLLRPGAPGGARGPGAARAARGATGERRSGGACAAR